MDIYQFGKWDGDNFVLHNELRIFDVEGNEHPLVSIDTTGMQFPLGIDRDDVVHAILSNAFAVED